MHLEQLATGFNAGDEPGQRLPLFNLLGKRLDNSVPIAVIQALGNPLIHQDLHITLGLADKNQHPGAAHRVVQVLLQKLPPRQVGRTPVAYRTRDQPSSDLGQAEHQAQHNERRPLRHQQGVHGQVARQVMHHTRHHQRDQARPQQRNVGVVVGARRQHGDQLRVGGFLDPGDRFGDLALLVFSQ